MVPNITTKQWMYVFVHNKKTNFAVMIQIIEDESCPPPPIIRIHFQAFGDIEEAAVIMDRTTGKSRGYGFVSHHGLIRIMDRSL